jgi:uncharacterized membrane protein YccC
MQRFLLRILSSKSYPCLLHGFKTALAVSLSYYAIHAAGLSTGIMAALSALVVMQMRVADTVELSVLRLLGALAGAAVGAAGALLAPDTLEGNLILLFGATLLCTVIARWNPRFRMASVAAAAVILASAGHADRLAVAGWQLLEIAAGVLIALGISICLWPVRSSDALGKSLDKQCCLAAQTLDQLTSAFLDRQRHLPPELLDPFLKTARENHELLDKVREHEALLYYKEHEQLGFLVQGLDLVNTHLNALFDALDDGCEPGVTLIMDQEIRNLSGAISATLSHIADPASGAPWPDLNLQERFCLTRMNELRTAGMLRRFSTDKLVQILAFYQSLLHLAETVDVLVDRVTHAQVKSQAS